MSTMTATATWLGNDDINFEVSTGSGHKIVLDSKEVLGARPMEMVLVGLGGCASYDVVSILQKSRQAITGVACQVVGTRADSVPAVFTDIHLHFIITGTDIKESQVAKAVELSADKYCSVSQMLTSGGVKVTHDFEIVAV